MQQIEKFEVRNRWTNAVQFTAEIECSQAASFRVKLGLAVRWAVKSGADLSEEALRPFKADFFLTLSSLHAAPLDAQHLIAKLRAGAVDGSTYGHSDRTECACLVGTLAQTGDRNIDCLDRNSNRPAEQWFLMIRPGDKPGAVDDDGKETGGGYAARKALEWAIDWCACHDIEPEAAALSAEHT